MLMDCLLIMIEKVQYVDYFNIFFNIFKINIKKKTDIFFCFNILKY